jgi:hypothetical protein
MSQGENSQSSACLTSVVLQEITGINRDETQKFVGLAIVARILLLWVPWRVCGRSVHVETSGTRVVLRGSGRRLRRGPRARGRSGHLNMKGDRCQ